MPDRRRIPLLPAGGALRALRSSAPWLAASAALALLFVGASLGTNSGRFALPLDDSYIFLQYSRQAAHGQFLRYTEGDAASSGATSLLYLLLLSSAYLAGIRGAAFPFLPVLLGALGLAAAAASARRLAGRLWGEPAATVAPLLLLAHGPLLWHLLAGMETCLFVPLLLLSLEALVSKRHGRYVLAASLLSLTRPEGWIAASLLSGFLLLPGRRPPRPALLLIPVVAGIAPLLLNLAASGHLQSNSFVAKSPLTTGVHYPPAAVMRGLRFLLFAVRDIFANLAPRLPETLTANDGSAAALFFAPGAAVLALAGAVASGASAPLTAALTLLVLLPAFFLPVHVHWERYLAPSFPLFLLLVAGGIGVAWTRFGSVAGRAITAVVLFFQLLGLGAFVVAYGLSSHDLAFMHIPLARWIDANIPATASVAANDIGAIAYYSRRRIIDLEGLATDALTRPARNGSASLYEAIESLPSASRPDYLCVFPSWYDPEFTALHTPVRSLRPYRVTIAAGNPMVIYRADWSVAGRGDRPADPRALEAIAGFDMADRLDVADLASERSHRYSLRAVDGAYEPRLRVMPVRADSTLIADGGRVVSGSQSFRAALRPGRDALLVLRTDGPARARILVDGRDAATLRAPGATPGRWAEEVLRLPAALITRSDPTIEIRNEEPHYTGFAAYSCWLYQ